MLPGLTLQPLHCDLKSHPFGTLHSSHSLAATKDTPAGGDVADASGFSPYPGNINVLAPALDFVFFLPSALARSMLCEGSRQVPKTCAQLGQTPEFNLNWNLRVEVFHVGSMAERLSTTGGVVPAAQRQSDLSFAALVQLLSSTSSGVASLAWSKVLQLTARQTFGVDYSIPHHASILDSTRP